MPPKKSSSSLSSSSSSSSLPSSSFSLGPYPLDHYQLENCFQGLQNLPDNSVDCFVLSPPYNLTGLAQSTGRSKGKTGTSASGWHHAIGYDSFEDNLPEAEYQEQQIFLLNVMHAKLKPGGSIFYNHKNRHSVHTEYSPLEWILRSNVNLFQTIVQLRSSVNQHTGFLTPNTERIYWLTKNKSQPKFFKSKLPMEYRGEVWNIVPVKESDHPAPFDIRLPYYCILMTCEPGDIVVDPYAGSGTTLLAAMMLKCKYLGFDLSTNYREMFIERFQQYLIKGEIDPGYYATNFQRQQRQLNIQSQTKPKKKEKGKNSEDVTLDTSQVLRDLTNLKL